MGNKINLDMLISSIGSNNREKINEIREISRINLNKENMTIREGKLEFLDNPMNDLFLKRPETSEIIFYSRFTTKKLPGETLALIENNLPGISFYKDEFFFNFDPFYSIRYNLNEQNKKLPNKFFNLLSIRAYWSTPKKIRKSVRKLARKRIKGKTRPPNDFLGTSTNVLYKIIENCLKSNNFVIQKKKDFFAVTHDIDTNSCYLNDLHLLLDVERKMNVPATGFFVPFGYEYTLKPSTLRDLASNHFEVGIHGYSHNGLLISEGSGKIEQKLRKSIKFFLQEDIDIKGFRSPWALRNTKLLEILCDLGFQYDSSTPDKDTLALSRPLPGLLYNRPVIKQLNGESKQRRFIVQFPNTYPQDVQILEDYQLDDETAFSYLKTKIDFIKDFEGIFIFHTHPIHIAKRLDFFERVIKYAQSLGLTPYLLKQVSTQFIELARENYQELEIAS